MNSSSSISSECEMSLLSALNLGPMSQEVLMDQDDLGLLTPNIFQQTHNGGDELFPDDGMDEVVSSAAAFLENWTTEKDPKINVISDVIVREADKPKKSTKLEQLLTMPRSNITRHKQGFYSTIRKADKKDSAVVKPKKKKKVFEFKVPATPTPLPDFMAEGVASTSATTAEGPISPILGGGAHKKHLTKKPSVSKGLKMSFEEKDERGLGDIFSQEEDKEMAKKFANRQSAWTRQYRDSVNDVNRLEREMEELKVRLSAAKEIRDRVKLKLDYFKLE